MPHAPTRWPWRPWRPWRRGLAALLAVVGLLLLAGPTGAAPRSQPAGDGPVVLVTRVDDPITPVIADHLSDVVDKAEDGGYDALVVELDTPGGLDSSMRSIVQDFLDADVPVIVHVSPSGARAASAGALIAWSAHIVAMAPSTTIGAATPVDLQGGEVGDKVVNDAAAYARAVAEARGRDVEVAAEAVTEGRALSQSEAVEAGVADVVVEDRAELLATLDGRRVEVADGSTVRLRTAGAVVEESDLSWFRQLLQWLADPNLAFTFLSLGTLGLIYELATPGLGLAGGAGVVLVLLALLALAVLPIDAAGLVFLALAAALFLAELFAPGIGVAAALGSVCLALAGLLLFRDDAPGMAVEPATVVPVAVVVGGAVVVAGRLALRSRTEPARSGVERLVGRDVAVARAGGRRGQALVDGAWWSLRGDEDLVAGDRVRVRRVEGLELVVEPAPGTDTTKTTDTTDTTDTTKSTDTEEAS